ncbi:MAG: dihydrolipoamide acetyltransferase family protein [Mycobacteriales bacterium]
MGGPGAGAGAGAGAVDGAGADSPESYLPPRSPDDLLPAPDGERTAVLVGYGPRTGTAERRARRSLPGAPVRPGGTGPVPSSPPPPARVSAASVAARVVESPTLAKPPVRKLAKDLGVDLREVSGSGPGGVVTRADVEAAALPGQPASAFPAGVVPIAAEGRAVAVDRELGRERGERRIPIRGVRKTTAANMVASAFTAPHVTEFLTVDATPAVELLTRMASWPEFAGRKLTPLTLVARALVLVARQRPEINATWDDAAGEIVIKDYVHLGFAAATPRGLVVPSVKDADLLSLPDLASALAALTATAREGKLSPADLTGSTITITNVGVFGVDTGTPILNPGEAAILCLGAIRDMPWVHNGEIAVRKVTQLSLSFDHRLVDGALGSAVLADVGAALADPARMLAWC